MSSPLEPVLAGEHAAIWGYGVLGALLEDDAQDRARTLLVAHERTRDQLRARILAAGGDPPVAAPAYELPLKPTDGPTATGLAAQIESRLAAIYADLVAAADDHDGRQTGVDGVGTCAVRTTGWSGVSEPFPGLPERATGS